MPVVRRACRCAAGHRFRPPDCPVVPAVRHGVSGGSTEITLAKGSTTPKGTRYVDLGNGIQAIQTDDGTTTFAIADHHGTGQLAIKAADMSLQQRRTTPFGTPRGTAPTAWPGTKGFVGGTTDTTTGLTHLGAREDDPTTGRFISLDPLLEPDRPQTLNGYSYANNKPATYSDPTGESFPECNGGGWVCNNGTEPVKTDKKYSKIRRKEAGDQLIAQGPSTNDRTRLHKYYNIYKDYSFNGYEYWETPEVTMTGWPTHASGGSDAVIREYTGRGVPTGRMLRWNPGGGHHGDGAYWRVVGPEGDLGGIIR